MPLSKKKDFEKYSEEGMKILTDLIDQVLGMKKDGYDIDSEVINGKISVKQAYGIMIAALGIMEIENFYLDSKKESLIGDEMSAVIEETIAGLRPVVIEEIAQQSVKKRLGFK